MADIKPLFSKAEQSSTTESTLSKPLLEFRAGKMNMAATSKLVVPDERKGMVQIRKSVDRLIHFIWKDRNSNKIEDDLIIFPDDIEFSRVSKCTTGRVYVLKFKSSPRRMFFWMQEPSEKKDKFYCDAVNRYLNKLPVSEPENKDESDTSMSAEDQSEGSEMVEINSEEISSFLSTLNSEQLKQLAESGIELIPKQGRGIIGEPTSSRSGTLAGGPVLINPPPPVQNKEGSRDSKRSADAVQLSDFQSILSAIKVPKTETEPPINLIKGFTPEITEQLIKNSKFLEAVKNFMPPSDGDVASEVKATISSPQFQQAIGLFSSALQSGQLGPVIQQFNLGDSAIAAAMAGDMAAFIKALLENDESKENEPTDTNMEH